MAVQNASGYYGKVIATALQNTIIDKKLPEEQSYIFANNKYQATLYNCSYENKTCQIKSIEYHSNEQHNKKKIIWAIKDGNEYFLTKPVFHLYDDLYNVETRRVWRINNKQWRNIKCNSESDDIYKPQEGMVPLYGNYGWQLVNFDKDGEGYININYTRYTVPQMLAYKYRTICEEDTLYSIWDSKIYYSCKSISRYNSLDQYYIISTPHRIGFIDDAIVRLCNKDIMAWQVTRLPDLVYELYDDKGYVIWQLCIMEISRDEIFQWEKVFKPNAISIAYTNTITKQTFITISSYNNSQPSIYLDKNYGMFKDGSSHKYGESINAWIRSAAIVHKESIIERNDRSIIKRLAAGYKERKQNPWLAVWVNPFSFTMSVF